MDIIGTGQSSIWPPGRAQEWSWTYVDQESWQEHNGIGTSQRENTDSMVLLQVSESQHYTVVCPTNIADEERKEEFYQ